MRSAQSPKKPSGHCVTLHGGDDLIRVGSSDERRRMIYRARILAIVLDAGPRHVETMFDGGRDTIDEFDPGTPSLGYILVTQRSPQPCWRYRDRDRDVYAELVCAAEPIAAVRHVYIGVRTMLGRERTRTDRKRGRKPPVDNIIVDRPAAPSTVG